ncbi:hypothetical protein M8C21_022216, partial [Ambrosia artemisiifolia]
MIVDQYMCFGSIGSLGEKGGHDTVEQVLVQNCNITGTKNGLRIKTVPNGSGYAKGIRFHEINLINVANPIIIDQHYCLNSDDAACVSSPSGQAVQVSDVTYTNIHGSSATKHAIIFSCSESHKCTNIVTNNVHITGGDALCINAQGEFVDTTPSKTLRIGIARIEPPYGGFKFLRPQPLSQSSVLIKEKLEISLRMRPGLPAVQVSDVMYLNIHGSSASKQAITFDCSGKYNCTGITTMQVGITGQGDYSYCKNTRGKFFNGRDTASMALKGMEISLHGCLLVVLLSFCCIMFSPETASAATFDVTSYGAKGDGTTDDSQAFLQAWADLCRDHSVDPTLIIPSGLTFLLSPLVFDGSSCKSPNVNIKLLGTITAPNTLEGWKPCVERRFWIYFNNVHGLTIDGPGQIDGQGSAWWRKMEKTETCDRPTALHFNKCPGLRLKDTTHINSPFLHISIKNSQDIDIGNLQIRAPENSPNTDGIDISASSHVHIHDSNIQTGDDCVAINGGVVDVNITNVFCGPGHGI